MFPPYCYLNVDAERLPIDCHLFTGIHTLLNIRTDSFKEELPPDNRDTQIIVFEVDMDLKSKKLNEAKLVPQFLVNNPNISITPTRSNQTPSPITKQPPVSTVNLISKASTPVSVVSLSYDHVNKQEKSSQKCIDLQEVKICHKRISSNPISNMPEKQPRLSINPFSKGFKEKKVVTKVPEKQIVKINQCKNNQIKNSSKLNNASVVSASSTAKIMNKIQELRSQNNQLTKHPINTEKICKMVDSTDAVTDEPSSAISKKFIISKDISIAHIKEPSTPNVPNNSIVLNYEDQSYVIYIEDIMNSVLINTAQAFKKSLSNEDLKTLIQNKSNILHSDVFGPSEIKSIMSSISSKPQPISHNNITTTSKPQSTSQAALKLQKTSNQPPPQQQSIQISPSSSKHTAPIKTSKLHLPIKQNDVKQLVASNQSLSSSKFDISATKKLSPVNKHDQKPTSSKNSAVSITPLPSAPKQLVGNLCGVKPPNVVCQPPLPCPDIKKCSKCKTVSEEDICTTCRMSSHLKGVTLTRIETPATQENNNNDKVAGNSKDNATEEIQYISSDDENEKECKSLEPVITSVETQEALNNRLDKLSLNPKLLEDILWQKELGVKDYFKFEKCTSIQIGSFTTTPAFSGDILICLHGIRMTINNADFEPVTIDVEIENIVKIFGYYVNQPSIVIYVNYLAAVGIQHLLKMNRSNNSCYFNPTSEDDREKRIIWSFDVKKCEQQQLEKLLLKLPKVKYEPLTTIRAEQILNKASFKKDENKRHAISQSDGTKKYSIYDNIELGSRHMRITALLKILLERQLDPNKIAYFAFVDIKKALMIYPSRLDSRQVSPVKILDYKMLAVDEYVNDILIEYYLSYWFMRQISKEDRARSFVFNTFFYTSLAKKFQPPESVRVEELSVEDRIKIRHNRVKKWTKHENIFEKDFIFVPINENFHWFMAVICYPGLIGPCLMEDGTPITLPKSPDRPVHSPCDSINHERDECDGNTEDLWNFNINYNEQIGKDYMTDVENLKKRNTPAIKQPCILVFDSLYDGTSRARIVATLREWLVGEYRATYNGMDRDFSSKSMWGGIVKLPQQPNFTDCGLYVMHYFEQFFKFPIVDYSFPIMHLENWFDDDDVVYNCKKRREVQQILIDMVEERTRKGFPLPSGITLPELNYIPNSNNTSSIPPSHPSHPNHPNHLMYLQRLATKRRNNYQNQNVHYYEHNDEEDNDCDEEECEAEECMDEEFSEDDEDAEEYSENHPCTLTYLNSRYSANYNNPDHREYYGEMVENGEWSDTEDQPEEDEDFQSEHDDYGVDRNFYDEDIDDDDDDDDIILPDDGNDLVNDLPAGSNNHRHHVNLQNVDSSDNLRSFRSNYLRISHVNDNNEDEPEPEVDELLNSKKHVKR